MNRESPLCSDSQAADDQLPTRKSLLGRLKNWQDDASWRDFFDTYWRLIYRFALEQGLTHQEAEEVVQDTVLAVAKGINKFEYRPAECAFKTWLLTVTRSKIANQFEKRARASARVHTADESSTGLLEKLPDLQAERRWETVWDAEWTQNLMESAIERVKQRVSIEQFQMFDLFVLKDWPAREVARTLGVTVAHVYVTKHRISKLVRNTLGMLERKAAERPDGKLPPE